MPSASPLSAVATAFLIAIGAVIAFFYAAAPLVLYGIYHRLGTLIGNQAQIISQIQAIRTQSRP